MELSQRKQRCPPKLLFYRFCVNRWILDYNSPDRFRAVVLGVILAYRVDKAISLNTRMIEDVSAVGLGFDMGSQLRRVSLREIYRCSVLSDKGVLTGQVDDVLFHPLEPRAVGYSVNSPRIGGVVKLPTKYLALDATTLTLQDELAVTMKDVAWGGKAERFLGFDWDFTVIWYGQDVYTRGGEKLGRISDALFSLEDGSLGGIEITGGTTADAALGKRSIPPEYVLGFSPDMHAVMVDDRAKDCPYDGGFADTAGRAAAQAQEMAYKAGAVAEKAAETAVVAAAKATVHTQRAIKAAAQSEVGKKTVGWFKSIAADVKDAMGDPDDESR